MSKTSASQSGNADIFTQLIQDFSVDQAVNWVHSKFSSFDSTSRGQIPLSSTKKNEQVYFSKIERLGYVTNLVLNKKTSEINKPLLVAAIEMKKELSERTSRLVQFNCAKRLLQEAVENPLVALSGLPTQGLFFFYDTNGRFRISLVTGQVENRRFKFNQAKRQSFFIVPDAVNRTVKHRLGKKINSFEALKEAFSVEALTKEFYDALFHWYEWAIDTDTNVLFPNDPSTKIDDRKQVEEAVIRLITRLMFVWFVLQKGIIPQKLFDEKALASILKKFDPQSMAEDNYYRAILQNLFFATFNCKPNKRKFVHEYHGKSNERGVKTCYRYQKEIINPADFLKLMKPVPFLNCALFDCLDTTEEYNNSGREMLLDGFSNKPHRQARVPNGLFFDEKRGLINLFKRYDFTVDENSSNDEDVALDPELLGKVFENLLAVFNPETQEMARKATGSYYTPREIVDYMVEESLKVYLINKVPTVADRINELFDRSKTESDCAPNISKEEQERLQEAIYNCKILDPACGSGAFPMGALHCMVHILSRLDPKNLTLSKRLREQYKKDANDMVGMTQRERKEYSKQLEERLLEGAVHPNYTRKLYLIENCIYGVDKQSIAAQISKLRFFLSLLCDQFNFSSFDSSKEQQGGNYGLLALPNLEAKFVCANTLIPLPNVNNADAMFSIPEVQELKEELQRNRHKIFTARTAETKQKYKKTDRDIRAKIQKAVKKALVTPNEAVIAENEALLAELTKQRVAVAAPKIERQKELVGRDLFTEGTEQWVEYDLNAPKRRDLDSRIDTARRNIEKEKQKAKRKPDSKIDQLAEMVASWDPYNQNVCSTFFDPEWMFNITNGFDIVIGNPPYGLINKRQNKGVSIVVDEKTYNLYKNSENYKPAQGQGINIFRLFILRSSSLLSLNGVLSQIFPLSYIGDITSANLRKHIFDNYQTLNIDAFPERDNENKRVFKAVKMSVCITTLQNSAPKNDFTLNIRYDKDLTLPYNRTILSVDTIKKIDQKYQSIPLVTQSELSLLEKVYSNSQPLIRYASCATGELDMTFCKVAFSKNSKYPILFRGANIGHYFIHSTLSQGEQFYVNEKELAKIKPSALTLKNLSRIIFQGVTGVNEKIRIKATYIEHGFCANSVNYIENDESVFTNKYLLAIFNSKLINFCFSKFSTNSNVNNYEIDSLPIIHNPNITQSITSLVETILNKKSENEMSDVSQLEAQIDQLVYQLYGLTEDEIAIVESSATNTTSTPAEASTSPAPRSRSSKKEPVTRYRKSEYLD